MNPEKVDPWKILVLEHDYSSEEVGDFFEKIWQEGITRKKIERKRLYHKDSIMKEIGNAVKNLEGKILTLYGEGSCHHYTYGLCNSIAKKRSKDYMYIHIDNHTDSCYTKDGSLDCTSFVENILEEPEAKDVLFIGTEKDFTTNYKNHIIIHQKHLILENAKEIIRKVLRKKQQLDVYPSLDLDVLKKTEIKTGYDQGMLELKHLLQALDVIKQEKNIISADVLGYYKLGIRRQPNHATNETSLLTYAAVAAKITGKDTKEIEALHNYFKAKLTEERTYPLNSIENIFKYSKEFMRITEQLKI